MKRRTLLKYAATLPILGLWPWRLASSHSPASARAGQLRAAGTLSCDTQPGGLAFPLSFPLVFQAACVAEPDAPTWTPPATATQAATATATIAATATRSPTATAPVPATGTSVPQQHTYLPKVVR